MKGRLTISPKGEACFAYEDDGYATPACYRTRQTDKGFRFHKFYATLALFCFWGRVRELHWGSPFVWWVIGYIIYSE